MSILHHPTPTTPTVTHPAWCDQASCYTSVGHVPDGVVDVMHVRRYTAFGAEPVVLTQGSEDGHPTEPLSLMVESYGLSAGHVRELATLLLTIAETMDEATR